MSMGNVNWYWPLVAAGVSVGVVGVVYAIWKCIKKSKALKRNQGPYGLINQGSTCYLNSVLQVLFMMKEIHEALDKGQRLNPTDQELKSLFNGLRVKVCGTERITKHLRIENIWLQRDAAEFMELLLKNLSPGVSEPFCGELQYRTTCSEGHCILKQPSPFWILPLPLPNSSVQDGLHQAVANKQLGLYCPQCKQETTVTRKCEMTTSPQVLALLLKRFDTESSFYHKDVDVPETVEIKGQSYSLWGLVDHYGSLSGGHYTATLLSFKDKNWYCFNDSHVEKTKEPSATSSHSAYLLIYRKDHCVSYNMSSGDNQPQSSLKVNGPPTFGYLTAKRTVLPWKHRKQGLSGPSFQV